MTGMETSASPGGAEETEGLTGVAGSMSGLAKPLVLVGLMGAGKTAIGRRLAEVLKLPFRDADEEIERAAGLTVTEIFEKHGEVEFRRGERKVIARLMDEPPHVLATGGGAFIDPATRALIHEKGISIWLKADLDVLMRRVSRRSGRPLLMVDDPRAAMAQLMEARYPIYAEADITVESSQGPHSAAVRAVIEALQARHASCAAGESQGPHD